MQIQALWSKKAREIVIAVIQSNDKKRSYTLNHSELKTLQPHKWLVGEVRKTFGLKTAEKYFVKIDEYNIFYEDENVKTLLKKKTVAEGTMIYV